MPPRNKTSQEAILKVASELADAEGLRGVGIRSIAARLDISPGTIYNVTGDIDDVILRVNAETLRHLQVKLTAEIVAAREPMTNVFAVADAYVDFVLNNAKRWSMILEHSLASDKALPSWYQEELDRTLELVDRVLKPIILERRERRRSVAILWASLQGLASLAASGKLSMVEQEDPHRLVRLLLARFLGSFQSDQSPQKKQETIHPTRRTKPQASPARGAK